MNNLAIPGFDHWFQTNGWSPLPDDELSDLLFKALDVTNLPTLTAYIQKVAKTDAQPVYHVQSLPGQQAIDNDSRQAVYWHHLRRDLAVFPGYFAATQKAGLTERQGADILLALASHASEFAMMGLTPKIENIRDILDQTAPTDPKTTHRGLLALLKKAKEDGSAGRATAIVKMGLAASMSFEQSLDIVNTIYERSSLPEYVFMRLYDELHAMASNTAGGDALHAGLKAILGDNPYREANFAGFTHLTYTAVAHTPHALSTVFQKIAQPSRKRLGAEVTDKPKKSPLARASTAFLPKRKTHDYKKPPEDYFPVLSKPALTHGVFPYRMSRSFADGLSDLQRLMKTDNAEGCFVFDPVRQIWYSLGGRTELGYSRVRHEHYPYDLSLLSETPFFLHVHPQETECFITPNRDSLVYPQLQDKLTKLMAALPSTADWNGVASLMDGTSKPIHLKSLIVTSTGITEMIFPQNASLVKDFAETYGVLRDQVLLNFDAGRYLRMHGVNDDFSGFVQTMLLLINRKFPDQFAIDQYPHDYYRKDFGMFNEPEIPF